MERVRGVTKLTRKAAKNTGRSFIPSAKRDSMRQVAAFARLTVPRVRPILAFPVQKRVTGAAWADRCQPALPGRTKTHCCATLNARVDITE